jgi:hypothetical protein
MQESATIGSNDERNKKWRKESPSLFTYIVGDAVRLSPSKKPTTHIMRGAENAKCLR